MFTSRDHAIYAAILCQIAIVRLDQNYSQAQTRFLILTDLAVRSGIKAPADANFPSRIMPPAYEDEFSKRMADKPEQKELTHILRNAKTNVNILQKVTLLLLN